MPRHLLPFGAEALHEIAGAGVALALMSHGLSSETPTVTSGTSCSQASTRLNVHACSAKAPKNQSLSRDLAMKSKQTRTFNAQALLDSTGIARTIVEYRRADVIFTQGDRCDHVLYIQEGSVKLSVVSNAGREGVVAMLGAGRVLW